MTEEQKQAITNDVKRLIPLVAEVTEVNKFIDFDFGYLYKEGKWQCAFWAKETIEPALEFFSDSIEGFTWILNRMK